MIETPSDASWPSPETDPVTRYALEVVSGQRPAGKWLRRACERHLWDSARAAAGTSAYRWRPELALKAIGLFRLFRHYKGEWGGQPIVLEPWQAFGVGSLFGWVEQDTGLRRFRNAFWELCRGNGKSTIAAGILILLTFFDDEPGAEGYAFATKKDQARIVFRTARQMVLRSPAIREFVTPLRHNLHCEDTESKLEALGADADTLDGLRPQCAVGDELHKQATPDLVEVMESGMGTRRQPLLLTLTTTGESDGLETVYGQHLSISHQVLDGFDADFDIPEWFAFIAGADPTDDWQLETTWEKANPNWGVSIKPAFVRKEFRKALANPAEQPKFRRYYCGQRVQALDAYFSLADWDACPPLPSELELRRCPSWIGIDLSSSIDVTAAVQVWRLAEDEIAVRPMFWLPDGLVVEGEAAARAQSLSERGGRDRVPYAQWHAEGHLQLTAGTTIDRTVVRRETVAVAQAWAVVAVCYDPWHAGEMTQAMQDEDHLVLVPIAQRFAMLSQPTKDVRDLILKRRVRHDRNPVMRWMVGNARPRFDDRENVMLCKRRSRGRIDGATALVTAMRGVRLAKPAPTYELLVIGGPR